LALKHTSRRIFGFGAKIQSSHDNLKEFLNKNNEIDADEKSSLHQLITKWKNEMEVDEIGHGNSNHISDDEIYENIVELMRKKENQVETNDKSSLHSLISKWKNQMDADKKQENDSKEDAVKSRNSRNKIVWIPYERDQDLVEYQDNFSPSTSYEETDSAAYQEEFLQAANLPEPTLLRQEKDDQSSSVLVSHPTPVVMSGLVSSGAVSSLVNIVNIVRCFFVILVIRAV